jgi:hypothetical protein
MLDTEGLGKRCGTNWGPGLIGDGSFLSCGLLELRDGLIGDGSFLSQGLVQHALNLVV